MTREKSITFEMPGGIVVDFDEFVKGTYPDFNGIRLTKMEKGYVEGELEITPKHLNPAGILHGGVAATLADTIAIFGCAALYGNPNLTTLNLNINYMRPARKGIVTAKCSVLTHGKHVSVWRVNVVNGGSEAVAEVTVTFAVSDLNL